jgi:quercetin dioxygenase-like cupin family protein
VADAAFERLLAEIRASAIAAVTPPPTRCDGCLYWRPAASITVVSIRGHRFQFCPGCEHARWHHPDEITIHEARHA